MPVKADPMMEAVKGNMTVGSSADTLSAAAQVE